MEVDIIYQFPEQFDHLAWKWLRADPKANFDDYGPQTFDDFEQDMHRRRREEEVWCVLADGNPVGVIGYLELSPAKGIFRGICFSKEVQGTPVTKQAIRMLLEKKFRAGVRKVTAVYFQDNERIGRFLRGLGAVIEGTLREDTVREGKPINSVIASIFADAI